jgi:hypothetical protein
MVIPDEKDGEILMMESHEICREMIEIDEIFLQMIRPVELIHQMRYVQFEESWMTDLGDISEEILLQMIRPVEQIHEMTYGQFEKSWMADLIDIFEEILLQKIHLVELND